eukprot:Nitzschia sp. Nitz4//scaffold28_size193895//55709//57217//NITZ4_001644-RA/size193895-processed-gene-0.256-mRNA-1//-1//CDS//3329545919//1726//frame0
MSSHNSSGNKMGIKRRLSPEMKESTSGATSSSATSGQDEVLPLYSETSGRQGLLSHSQHRQASHRTLSGTSSVDDDSDSLIDDLSSTCSSRVSNPQTSFPPLTSMNRASTSSGHSLSGSVVSEPTSLQSSQSLQLHRSSSAHRLSGLPLHRQSSQLYNKQQSCFQSAAQACSNGLPLRYYPYEERSLRNTLVFTARKRKNPFYILLAVFSFFGVYFYSKGRVTVHNALSQVLTLTEEHRQVQDRFQNVQQQIRELQRHLMELLANAPGLSHGSFSSTTSSSHQFRPDQAISRNQLLSERDALQEKLEDGNTQIVVLQKHLQEINRREALGKYGSGKILVELELEFPGVTDDGGPNTIIMEMAPIELMPHSVYMFLEMVSAHLFDGCSFILNAMHVVKAAPLPYDGSSASAKVKSFARLGLESVSFKEYNPAYPHRQYTVGFAADGSPSFYINTEDNSDVHIGDPCFAKIVSGVDTVHRLEKAPTRNGIWYRKRIGLKRATIL